MKDVKVNKYDCGYNLRRIGNYFKNFGCKEWREEGGSELLIRFFNSERIISDIHKSFNEWEYEINGGEEE